MIRIVENSIPGQGPTNPSPGLEVKQIFAQNGVLQTSMNLEHRPQQENMAQRVSESLHLDSSLLFEAGTGVGKSLAYLVPGLIFAQNAKRPFIVSTHTISLQEQILKKDLPLCRLLFDQVEHLRKYRDFQATLLAGKGNYLCTSRLTEALKHQAQTELFEDRERKELQRIATWSQEQGCDGMRQGLSPRPDFEVWDRVSADSSLCSRKRCSPQSCFYQKARDRLATADVIVVNHSLLFALLGAGMGPETETKGILFAEDFLVLDEAHQVPKVASDYFGSAIGSYGVALTLRRLWDSRKKKGLLVKWGSLTDKSLVEEALEATDALFYHVRENLLGDHDARRVLNAHALPSDFEMPLKRLTDRLRELSLHLDNEAASIEVKDQTEKLESMVTVFRAFQEMDDPENVFWVERYGKRGAHVQLRITPLDPAPMLKTALFDRGVSAVLTSATLTQEGTMDRFSGLVGAEGIDSEVEKSPFDYEKNVQVFVARDSPDPREVDRMPYLDHLSELVFRCAEAQKGGTLALFTNFADLKYVDQTIGSRWKKLDRELYVHGANLPRHLLSKRFKENGKGLLLGAESFWMGIDVPGDALSQVIITRLPFQNPNHPVVEAKSEKTRSEGGNPFSTLTLPEALSRFKQGLGRLIRNKSDRGLLTILDSRVLRKSYGKRFLSELPKKDYHSFSLSTLRDEFPARGGFEP